MYSKIKPRICTVKIFTVTCCLSFLILFFIRKGFAAYLHTTIAAYMGMWQQICSRVIYNAHDQVDLRYLSFSLCYHIPLYVAITTYKYAAKPFPFFFFFHLYFCLHFSFLLYFFFNFFFLKINFVNFGDMYYMSSNDSPTNLFKTYIFYKILLGHFFL